MNKEKFIFHEDSGHGWLEVDIEVFTKVCSPKYVNSKDIYGFGYWDMEKGKVYLEEDCEAPDFMKRYEKKYGKDSFEIDNTYEDGYSELRWLPHLFQKEVNRREIKELNILKKEFEKD